MYRFLMADETFRALNIPISRETRKELDRKILKGEFTDPILSWNGYILTGYEKDDIALKYHRTVATREMFFPRKCDAVAWLCREQLKRTDLNWTAKAWLISRLYEALRDISRRKKAKDDFQYRQLSPSLQSTGYTQPQKESRATMKQLGEEFSYHRETIRRYIQFGRQLDKLEEMVPGTRIRILTGELSVMMVHMPMLIRMPTKQLEQLISNRHTRRLIPPAELPAESPKKRENRQKKEYTVQPAIKQMPAYDPDAELNGLRYTVETWRKAIARTAIRADLAHATEAGKEDLKQVLQKLIRETECLCSNLEGKQND